MMGERELGPACLSGVGAGLVSGQEAMTLTEAAVEAAGSGSDGHKLRIPLGITGSRGW